MAEQLKSKRVFFPKGKQGEFLLQSKNHLDCTWGDLAEICQTGARNLNSWRNEHNSMTLSALKRICQKRKVMLPAEVILKDAYWYTAKGASVGGKAVVEKYGKVGGDEAYRKKKWHEWWEREGKFKPSKITDPLPFRKPPFSEELAEFVGIILGDGGISDHQITVTLHRVTDRKYSLFVRKLIKKLFGLTAGEYCDNTFLADSIVISRTGLVQYCTEELGLKKGNKVKQQVDIPDWIKGNKSYKIACLRGLIDTDGCVIIHQYLSKGKKYCYKKVSFTNRSHPLIQSLSGILSDRGISHRIARDKWDVRIEAKKDVDEYFRVVGTSNPKHRSRYKMA